MTSCPELPNCSIVPPFIFENIAMNGTAEQREAALHHLDIDATTRATRMMAASATTAAATPGPPREHRLIYDAQHTNTLPGTLVRSEGQGPVADVDANDAYDGLGDTWSLYANVFNRNSIDDAGMDLIGSVHVGTKWNNAQWDGAQMRFGDGDGVTFNRLTIAVDIMGHELTHGVTQYTAGLLYQDQAGALNESVSDVFGSLVKQYAASPEQTAANADWLIGAGIWAPGINGVALRSMKAPGTAFNDPVVGKDPQPAHMRDYLVTTRDFGGVHTNSGIPNHAFYLLAVALGGHAWDQAGPIWYETLRDSRLKPDAEFVDFATLTADNALRLYGATVEAAVIDAWTQVGVATSTTPAATTTAMTASATTGGHAS
jgi:Zn-dependent metalloprotease